MTKQEKVIEISDQLLTFLLDYRTSHPGFTFWLRSRESSRSDDKKRLQNGQWFQGSDYIFVSFHNASGHMNMTRSIGWVLTLDGQLKPRYHISVVWSTEQDQQKIGLYQDLIQHFQMTAEGKNKYYKMLPNEEMFISLKNFIERTLPQINQIIEQHGLTEMFTITEEKFETQLSKVMEIRDGKLQRPVEKAINEKDKSETAIPLNIILYGPPGTGKTYHTVDKALQIAAPEIYDQFKDNREEITRQFRKLLINDWEKPAGQIAFVTFHQSMTYEDFVEGIKPIMRPEISGDIQYEISNGIFKRLCVEASRTKQVNTTIVGDKEPLTKELFEELYYSFSQGLPHHVENTSPVTFSTKEGYPFDLFRNGVNSIVVKAGEKRVGQNVSLNELWAVINENKAPTYKSYEQIIIDKLLEGKSFETSTIENQHKNYVLIIDEINRGNVSQVFGELITLLEEGKRQGQTEELIVTLPYSKKAFSVPANLYIIGTMNTADRSVEALDTALRRRFSFEEIIPQGSILNSYQMLLNLWWKYRETFTDDPFWMAAENSFNSLYGLKVINEEIYDNLSLGPDDNPEEELSKRTADDFIDAVEFQNGLELNTLLNKINRRLEKLLSKDHQIGHAFFINVFSVQDLYNVFYQKLIPQLQEYFYGDFGKIGLVLGKSFVKSAEEGDKIGFAPFDYEGTESLMEKAIYRIEDFAVAGITNYDNFLISVKNIYQ
jgi:hypothetical protein